MSTIDVRPHARPVRLVRLFLLLSLGLLPWTGARAVWSTPPWRHLGSTLIVGLPPQVRQTIKRIRRGGPFPFRSDGFVYQNRQNRLPPEPNGYYHVYAVPTPGVLGRGRRRLITGKPGEFYYSPDLYHTIWKLKE